MDSLSYLHLIRSLLQEAKNNVINEFRCCEILVKNLMVVFYFLPWSYSRLEVLYNSKASLEEIFTLWSSLAFISAGYDINFFDFISFPQIGKGDL